MKRKTASVLALLTAIFGALGLTALRFYQLSRCMDENGLLISGSRVVWGFVGLIVLVIVLLVLTIVRQDGEYGTEDCLHRGTLPNLLSALFAGAFMVSCAYCSIRLSSGDQAEMILSSLGVLAGALLLISDALRLWGKKSHMFLMLLPTLLLAARLIVDFKQWSTDPIVIDFCFRLLASVFTMLACFQLAGFPLGYGKKRATIFLCMLSFVFSAMTVSDCLYLSEFHIREMAVYLSMGLWAFVNGLMLLFPKQEAPAEEKPAVPETAPEAPEEER